MIHQIRLSLAGRFPALTSRDFAIFWLGHLLSLVGTSMQNTAQPLLAYRLSGRPLDLGVIGFAFALPTFFLAFPSGVLVERWDKRKAVMILQAVMMIETLVLAVLTLTGRIQIWHIIVLSMVLGIATTFEITARQSMLIELVGGDLLPNAIALQSTAFNMSRVLGPALAAPLLLILPSNGEGWIFLLNALSFGAILISLFSVRLMHRVEPTPSNQSIARDFLDGGRYILAHRNIAAIILLAAILGLFGMPVMQQIPVLAKDVLAQVGDTKSIVDARNSALYLALGSGALTAALSIAFNNSAHQRGARLVLGEAAFIVGLLGIAFLNRFWFAVALVALMGWGGVTQFATMNTLLQTQVANDLRGRVYSVYLWSFQGIAPFGSLLIGWMTQNLSLPVTAMVCGVVCLFGLGGIQLFFPAARRSAA
ncbi:MAG: MFS transporter [Anaerolineales bacterium]|jgi:MFS family permease|nr:MFS transporter [Anaerolineales bacterium]MCC7187444.1 MFS transporter [Anaerolineales bacterium]